MQEPEIFEQPVASKDVEAVPVGDDHHTYQTAYTYQTNNTAEDSSLDDYHDFVYPEGESRRSFPCSPTTSFVSPCPEWDHLPTLSRRHSVSHRV
jgi:hypothetical protein